MNLTKNENRRIIDLMCNGLIRLDLYDAPLAHMLVLYWGLE